MSMPKGYKHTKEAIEKIRQAGLGRKVSKETREKISKSQKGIVNVGKRNSPATEIKKGQHFSQKTEFRKGHSVNKGKHILKPGLKIHYKKSRITTTCDNCKKKLSLIPWEYKNLKHHFCDKVCRSNYYKGDKNNKWKGGITPLNVKLRNSIKYKKWRKDVYMRDNFTCQVCGEKGGTLHSHHIKKWSGHKKLRFVVDNGLTVCKKCHLSLHKKGGKL